MTGEVKDFLRLKGDVSAGAQLGSATAPTYALGDGDTGFYESTDDQIDISIDGTTVMLFRAVGLEGQISTGPAIINEAASSTNPTIIANKTDNNSGLGQAADDAPCIVAGAIEALRFTEASNHIIQTVQANVGLTADVGSVQGSGIILSSYNVYDTVGTAGDCATLPATFPVGTIIYVKNGAAANSMDVFPASGDDLGAGANTAVAIAAGNFKVFLATTANSTWEQIMGGTA